MQLRNLIGAILLLGLIWPSLSGDSIPQIGKARAQQELSQDNSDAENQDKERVEAKV